MLDLKRLDVAEVFLQNFFHKKTVEDIRFILNSPNREFIVSTSNHHGLPSDPSYGHNLILVFVPSGKRRGLVLNKNLTLESKFLTLISPPQSPVIMWVKSLISKKKETFWENPFRVEIF